MIENILRKWQPLCIPEYVGTRLVPITRGVKIVETNVIGILGQVPTWLPLRATDVQNQARQLLASSSKIPVFTQEREPLRVKWRFFQLLEDRAESENAN